MFIETDGQQVQ